MQRTEDEAYFQGKGNMNLVERGMNNKSEQKWQITQIDGSNQG